MNVLSDWSVRNRTGAAFDIAHVNDVARETGESATHVLHATGDLNVQSNRLKGVIESFLHEMATT